MTHLEEIGRLTMTPILTASERRLEAAALVEGIKGAIAGGRSFTNPHVSEFFVSMRDRFTEYGPNTFVSPGQLRSLRKVGRAMKGKRK